MLRTREAALRASILTQKRAKALRRTMTAPERTLWAMLKGNQQQLHFRRQHAVGPYILDFYCAAAKLCIEVDGPVHAGTAEHDARRTRWLAEQGIRVIRFSVEDVEARPAAVIAAIVLAAAPSTARRRSPSPATRERLSRAPPSQSAILSRDAGEGDHA